MGCFAGRVAALLLCLPPWCVGGSACSWFLLAALWLVLGVPWL